MSITFVVLSTEPTGCIANHQFGYYVIWYSLYLLQLHWCLMFKQFCPKHIPMHDQEESENYLRTSNAKYVYVRT